MSSFTFYSTFFLKKKKKSTSATSPYNWLIIWPYTLSFFPTSSFWQLFLTRSMMSRRWSSNLFCCTSALLSTMPFSCWWADRYDVTDWSLKNAYFAQVLSFFRNTQRLCLLLFWSAEADGRVTETVWRTDAILQTPDVSKRPLPHV